jgi:hypothetical protein
MDDLHEGRRGFPERRRVAEALPEPIRNSILAFLDQQERELQAIRAARDIDA